MLATARPSCLQLAARRGDETADVNMYRIHHATLGGHTRVLRRRNVWLAKSTVGTAGGQVGRMCGVMLLAIMNDPCAAPLSRTCRLRSTGLDIGVCVLY